MTGWDELAQELDRWEAAGKRAALWWRDDDATAPTPELDRLLALRRRHNLPLALAVIPAEAGPALAERLRGETDITILQHGYAHLNHAPAGAKKCELTDTRPMATMLAELAAGKTRLANWAGFLPVLVPPWNRIAPALVPLLAVEGFRGLSGFGTRGAAPAGLGIGNTHLDPVAWRAGGGFVGLEPMLRVAIEALEARRSGRLDPTEPIGLLTHHRAQVETVWDFVAEYLLRTRGHPGACWLAAREVFGVAA
jgi:hypothetical protein